MSLYVELSQVSKVFPVNASGVEQLVSGMSQGPENPTIQGKTAVEDISLRLVEGERLGIVGRNGAGKSTLLHMIAGITEPTDGHIHINGKVTSIMTLGIGLRDDLTGRENIYIDGEIQGKSREDVDCFIDEIIEFSELGKFIEYPVRTYSTGMKARLAFSLIAHIDPEILIIDEALSVGDASFSAKATARILEICARGKIVILVSHGMQSIREICNRCLYLKDGRLVMDGPPDVVTKAYIDEVRQEDEERLFQRFSHQVGKHSYRNGSEIWLTRLYSGENKDDAIKIEAGKKLRIHIKGQMNDVDQNSSCRIKIVRMDDVIFFEEEFRAIDFLTDYDKIDIHIYFKQLVLGQGIYRLDVKFLNLEERKPLVMAEASTIFEVYSLMAPSGGKPMLLYPISAATLSP